MEREYFLDLIPAYALGALDEDERAEFESQLADDLEAQVLLDEYRLVVDSLPLTVGLREAPAHLSEDLRRRIMAVEAAPLVSGRVAPAQRWLSTAAILAAVFGLTFLLAQLQPQPSYYQRAKARYEQLAATEGVVQVSLDPADDFEQVVGQLLANPADNSAVLMIENLPVLNEDQAYQLWVVTTEGVVSSGGVYGKTAEGPTYIIVHLDQPLSDYRNFGCSLEPAEGSPYPNRRSGPGVFRVSLTEA
jgi:anti-sigma-K factor RskA